MSCYTQSLASFTCASEMGPRRTGSARSGTRGGNFGKIGPAPLCPSTVPLEVRAVSFGPQCRLLILRELFNGAPLRLPRPYWSRSFHRRSAAVLGPPLSRVCLSRRLDRVPDFRGSWLQGIRGYPFPAVSPSSSQTNSIQVRDDGAIVSGFLTGVRDTVGGYARNSGGWTSNFGVGGLRGLYGKLLGPATLSVW